MIRDIVWCLDSIDKPLQKALLQGSLESFHKLAPDNLSFHLVTLRITDGDIKDIFPDRSVTIHTISPDALNGFGSDNQTHHWTRFCYTKLLVPQILQKDNILYVDTDVMAQKDYSSLLNLQRESGKVVAAALEVKEILRKHTPDYCNTGVVVFWDHKKFTQAIDNNPQACAKDYVMPDQDLFDILMKGKIQIISNDYNTMQEGSGVLRHLAGPKGAHEWYRRHHGFVDKYLHQGRPENKRRDRWFF